MGNDGEQFRTEHDSMGEVRVPADALWRAQTQRAVENFPISGTRLEDEHVKALARVKMAAAVANASLGVVDAKRAEAIEEAAREVVNGEHLEHFPLDVFQTGSGTSSNMNMNEVLASLAAAARASRCTPTTTSTPASRATTSSRPRSTSPPSPRCRTSCCRRSPTSPRRSRRRPRSSPTW